MKKMAFTLSLISKIFFSKNLREGFEAIKYNGKPQRLAAIENIVERANERKKNGIKLWLEKMRIKQNEENEKRRIREIQDNFLRKIMKTKTGKIVEAFVKLKQLPERKNTEGYKRASKFKDGLTRFVENQLKGCFTPFKN